MDEELQYASAVFSMLDRDTKTVKKMTCYPITRVQLQEFAGNAIVTSRDFVVNDSGKWVEAQ